MTTIEDTGALVERALDQDLDEWTKRIIGRQFDPETGSPYWLRRAATLSFDPRDITKYTELAAFGTFALDELRTLDPGDLVPLAVPRPLAGRIWESGGTTGEPCRVFYTEQMLRLRGAWRRWSMRREGFEEGRTWLQATPSGPHLIGHSGWDLVQLYGARVYSVDFDPRWVKRALRTGRLAVANEYIDHVIEQVESIVDSQHVDYLVTTPALLQALIRTRPALVAAVAGVRMTGTHVTPEVWRTFRQALGADKPLVVMYGNTFGNTMALPVLQDGELMPHLPNYPQVTMAVVDQDDWTRTVDHTESGRVRMTVLHEDLFLPNVLERDLAVRYDTGRDWPCDGVANVRPLYDTPAMPEGIY
ncbi:arylcarboxylate reductase [Amycolatopsis sp. CA-128772]|uniref:arylcarboxylate reductase n=1 Tax=Amycolatopsis sp. CA-128772 TaxID=2073159 RepID=UPI000CD1E057|nr:arylcarboxylate reductase [Amycolatopsis sp. CA-128772]